MTAVPHGSAHEPAALGAIPDVAPAWTIRPELPVDLDQVHELHRIAHGSLTEADRIDAIRSSADFDPLLTLAAVTSDGTVLGHVAVHRALLHPPDGAEAWPALVVASLAVLPPHQGRGIATALLTEVLAEADARGERLIAVHGPPALFEPFGFRAIAGLDVHGPWKDADRAFLVRTPAGTTVPAGTLELPAVAAAGDQPPR
jgi:putative acetyltransferase